MNRFLTANKEMPVDSYCVYKKSKTSKFYLAMISTIVLFLGIGFRANGHESGNYILITGTLLAAIHCIWAIADAISRPGMPPLIKKDLGSW